MFIEIEETVCFLASFLYGKVPRSRVDAFCEHAANGLVERIYGKASKPAAHFSLVVHQNGLGDSILHRAAADAFLNVDVMLALLPTALAIEMSPGSVYAVNTLSGARHGVYPRADGYVESCHDVFCTEVVCGNLREQGDKGRRPQFHVEFSLPTGMENDETAVPRPFFEVQHEEQIYTAQAFAATRFGSTKLKTYQEIDTVRFGAAATDSPGGHPFTMPSVYAYLQLLVFLNAIACVSILPEDEDEVAVEDDNDNGSTKNNGSICREDTSLECISNVSNATCMSFRGSVTGSQCSDEGAFHQNGDAEDEEEPDALTEQLLKCKDRETFASGDSNDSGAYCVTSSGLSDTEAN